MSSASDNPGRMAIGIMPDAGTLISLCEQLLNAGCEGRQILILGHSPIGICGPDAGRLSLRWLPPVVGESFWMLARWHSHNLMANSDSSVIDRCISAIRRFLESSSTEWWTPFQAHLDQKQTMVILLLDSPSQEVVYGKMMLAHAIDQFQTMPVPPQSA